MLKKKLFSKNMFLFFIVPAIVFILDRVFKNIVANGFTNNLGFFKVHHVVNTGISWGMLKGNSSILLWLSIAIVGVLLYFYKEISAIREADFGLHLVLVGAFSNILDRIFFGHVIDYIDFGFFPVFNLADACVTLGALYIIFVYVYDSVKK